LYNIASGSFDSLPEKSNANASCGDRGFFSSTMHLLGHLKRKSDCFLVIVSIDNKILLSRQPSETGLGILLF